MVGKAWSEGKEKQGGEGETSSLDPVVDLDKTPLNFTGNGVLLMI